MAVMQQHPTDKRTRIMINTELETALGPVDDFGSVDTLAPDPVPGSGPDSVVSSILLSVSGFVDFMYNENM